LTQNDLYSKQTKQERQLLKIATIGVEEMMGTGQHWYVVEQTKGMGGITPWRADENG
jgi:hypothetical protein